MSITSISIICHHNKQGKTNTDMNYLIRMEIHRLPICAILRVVPFAKSNIIITTMYYAIWSQSIPINYRKFTSALNARKDFLGSLSSEIIFKLLTEKTSVSNRSSCCLQHSFHVKIASRYFHRLLNGLSTRTPIMQDLIVSTVISTVKIARRSPYTVLWSTEILTQAPQKFSCTPADSVPTRTIQ